MVIKNGIYFEELFNAQPHTVLYIHTVFDPMFLEGVGDKFCGVLISPHFSDDAPDRLAAMQQSVK